MDDRSKWHEPQFHTGADLERGLVAGRDHVSDLDSLRRQDIPFFSVAVVEQGNESGTVGVILDRSDFRWDIFLIALEIDDAEHFLVPSALMADGDVPMMITAASPLFRDEKGFRGW